MRSPVPVRQRFRPGIDEIPDDVLEQIAHAGDCSCNDSESDPRDSDAARYATIAISNWRLADDFYGWPDWRRAARWAARLLGVEVR